MTKVYGINWSTLSDVGDARGGGSGGGWRQGRRTESWNGDTYAIVMECISDFKIFLKMMGHPSKWGCFFFLDVCRKNVFLDVYSGNS